MDVPEIEVTPRLLAQRAGSGESVSEKILNQCVQTIQAGEKLLRPRTAFSVFSIDKITDEKVYLSNSHQFVSAHLAKLLSGADKIAVMCCTIGADLEQKASALQKEGDPVASYFLDIYGAVAVSQLARSFYKQIKNLFPDHGVTVYMEPGQLDWHIDAQKTVWQLINPGEIGITLGDTMMMHPVKSLTGVFGLGDKDMVKKGNFSCVACPKREYCSFRHEAEEMMQDD